LSASLERVKLTAEGSTVPFLEADAVRLDLPAAAVTGALRIQWIEIDGPRVTIVRSADGSWNLPRSTSDSSAPLRGPIEIGRLLVRDLAVRYTDAMGKVDLDSRGLTIDMTRAGERPLAGRLTMAEPARFRRGDRATAITTFESPLSFDGETLSVGGLDVTAPEARVRISGSVGLLGAEPRMDLTSDATLDASRVAPWLDLTPAPGGRVVTHARIDGPLSAPRLDLRATTEELTWPSIGAVGLDGHAILADGVATVESMRVTLARGDVAIAGRTPVSGVGSSEAQVRWRNLDVDTLARAAGELPVRFAASATGDLTLSWQDQDLAGGRGRLTMTLAEIGPTRAALPIAGRIDASLDNRHWSLTTASRIPGAVNLAAAAEGRVESTLASSTISGRASVGAVDLDLAGRRLAAGGLDLGLTGVRGTAAASADLSGTFGAWRAAGTLNADQLVIADTGPGTAAARFTATPDTVALDEVRFNIGPNALTANAVIGLEKRTLSGQIDGTLPQLSAMTTALPETWRPDGAARVSGRLGGTLDKPVIDLTVSSDGLRVADQPIQSLQSTLQIANRTLVVRTLDIMQNGGRLTASGQYAFDGGRYSLSANGSGLAIDIAPVRARGDLQLKGAGVIDRPQIEGTIDLSELQLGDYSIGPTHAGVALANGRASIHSTVPSLGTGLDATIDFDARTIAATAVAVNTDLAALRAPIALAGSVSARATANGSLDHLADMNVNVELNAADATLDGVPVRLDHPARLRRDSGQLVADDVDLRIGGSTISARGRLGAPRESGERLTISLDGSAADFLPFVHLSPGAAPLDVAGTIQARLQAAGPMDAPDITGEIALSKASLKSGDLPPVTDIALAGTYARGRLNLSQISGRWQGVELAGQAAIPLGVLGDALSSSYVASLPDASGAATSTLRVTSITPDVLAPFVDPATIDQIAGQIDLSATLQATRFDTAGISGEVTLDTVNLQLARLPIGQASPTRLRLANGRVEVMSWRWTGPASEIDISGSAALTGDAPTLNLTVVGALDLRMLGAFVPDIAVLGQAMIDLRANGPAADPSIEGAITVADADVVLRNPRVAISDLRGTATLTRNHVQLRDVTASANGGELSAEGGLDYGAAAREGTLKVTGRDMAFELLEGLRTDVNADLTLSMAGGDPSIGGKVTILRGNYRRRIKLTDLLSATRTAPALPGTGEQSLLDRTTLDIAIVTADDIVVDNNYARVEAGTQLTLAGTIAAPALTGRLALGEGGRVFLGGRTYAVRRGTIAFTNPTRIEPQLDLALETRVQQDDITLAVTGPPDALEVDVRSPGLSQQDAISMLLTGQPADESTANYTEIAQGQLLMLLSGELLGAAGQAIGLDSVRVGRGLGSAASTFDLLISESDPETRLTITKNLRRDVELIMSQNLSATGEITWIVTYRPTRRIELRAATNDDDSQTYEFRHEIPFGGRHKTASDADKPKPAPSPRVSSVDVNGLSGPLADEARGTLRLHAGDRFDFYKWQEDRDRLIAKLRERGYLEARIAAGRPPIDTDTVALSYDVTPGPRTNLVIEGFEMPAGVIAEMKNVWTQALYDTFLTEDLTAVARRALVARGHLTSEVVTTISQPSAGEKTALVRVVPGPQFDDRRLAFDGNKGVPSATLDDLVGDLRLDVDVWLDPERVRTALENYYHSVGYLDATVMVQPPRFEGVSAILPVKIDEGSLYRIGDVAVEGSAPRSADEVRSTLGIEKGAAYKPAAIEPARRKVEGDYLRRGYNKVRVRAEARPDRARATVDLAIAIEPGPLQVLETVSVNGAGVTTRGTIDTALRLPIGKPLGLGELFNAQKRLYDTGVFQSVDVALEPVAAGAATTSLGQPVKATVTVREMPRYRLRYGFRVIDQPQPEAGVHELQPGLVTDLLNRNLLGRAVTAGVAGQIESDRLLGRAILSLPTFLRRSIVTNVFLTQSREETAPEGELPFIDKTLKFTVEQKVKPARKMSISYGLSFDKKHVYESNPDPDSLSPFDVRTNVTRLTGAYAWDTRDDPSNATRGWFHSSGLEYGPEALGSELRFIRYLAQQYYMRRAGSRTVLATAFRFGAGKGFDDQELIPSERFFAGGGTSVRGFAQDGLGERNVLGNPAGGQGMVVFNQEVRIRAHKWFSAVGFFDAGNVFPEAHDISFKKLEAGTGFGLRVVSPFVILRVDFGIPLTSRDSQPRGRWYFGIGHTF
jgi:outer membrane protein assembly factor BamA/autotransporter translocation and assembly factor TamB